MQNGRDVSIQGHCVSGAIHQGDQRSQNIRTGTHRFGASLTSPSIHPQGRESSLKLTHLLVHELAILQGVANSNKSLHAALFTSYSRRQRLIKMVGNNFKGRDKKKLSLALLTIGNSSEEPLRRWNRRPVYVAQI